jgi:hypothetical protein
MPKPAVLIPQIVVDKLENYVKTDQASSTTVDVNEILEIEQAYIIALARQEVPFSIVSHAVLRDEIDELAQSTLIKYWLALTRRQIISPKAYIRSIAHSQALDMLRRYKPILPLPLDEEGEIYHGNAMVVPGEGMQDPAQEFERDEIVVDWLEKIVGGILSLPRCQQYAMICSLKDHLEDTHPLLNAFREHGIDIEAIQWPQKKADVQSLQSSLSVARKKMRALIGKYASIS